MLKRIYIQQMWVARLTHFEWFFSISIWGKQNILFTRKFFLVTNQKQPQMYVRQNSYLDLWSNTLYSSKHTSWTRLSSSSSEDVYKTSSRRLNQDEYIHHSHTSSEDVFKTSWARPIYSSWRSLEDVF